MTLYGKERFFCCLALAALVFWGGTLWARDDPAALNARKQELKRVENEIKEKKAREKKLERAEESILSTLEEMDLRLRTYQKTVGSLQDKIKKKEGEMEYVRETLKALEVSIAERKTRVAQRVRRMYMDGTKGVWAVLIPSPEYPRFLKRIHNLTVIAEKEADMLSLLEAEQAEWQAKTQQIGNIKQQLAETQEPLISKLSKVDQERENKRILLARIRNEKAYYEKVIPELDKASSELKGLIKNLEEERHRREAQEEEHRRREALVRNAPVPAPAPSLPGHGFAGAKGQLPWPNQGPMTSSFGRQKHPRFDTYIFKKGIEIEALQGGAVQAIYGGTVVYADWFRGYGMIIILDHGDYYYSVYGYLAKLSVIVGEKVERHRVIGFIGDTGLSDGKHLYFELRHQGDPMDPIAWLQKRG